MKNSDSLRISNNNSDEYRKRDKTSTTKVIDTKTARK